MPRRVAHIDPHRHIPAIGNRRQLRIDRGAQAGNEVGQRIAEILVLAAAKAMPCHHDPTAEQVVQRIQRGQRGAFLRAEQAVDLDAPLCIELGRDALPIDCLDPIGNVLGPVNGGGQFDGRIHACASLSSSARLRSTPQR